MREKNIEAYLRDQVKAAGGIAYKFISPGNNGVPDRLVLLPGKVICFVETKAPGETPTALQLCQQRLIRKLGFDVFTADNKALVDLILGKE